MSDHKKIKYNSSTKKDDISEFTLDEINSLVGSNVLVNGYRGDSFKSLASFLASHAQSKHVIYITEGEITIEPLVESICRTRYCYFISNNYEESNLFNLSFTAPLSFSRDSLFNDDISLMKSCRRRIQMLDELIDLKIDRTCSSFFEEVLFETYRLVGMNSPSDFTRDKFLELLLRDDEDFKYSVPMKIEKRKEFSKKIEGISNGLAGRLFINDQKTLADYNTDTESMVIMDFSGLTKGQIISILHCIKNTYADVYTTIFVDGLGFAASKAIEEVNFYENLNGNLNFIVNDTNENLPKGFNADYMISGKFGSRVQLNKAVSKFILDKKPRGAFFATHSNIEDDKSFVLTNSSGRFYRVEFEHYAICDGKSIGDLYNQNYLESMESYVDDVKSLSFVWQGEFISLIKRLKDLIVLLSCIVSNKDILDDIYKLFVALSNKYDSLLLNEVPCKSCVRSNVVLYKKDIICNEKSGGCGVNFGRTYSLKCDNGDCTGHYYRLSEKGYVILICSQSGKNNCPIIHPKAS